MVCLVLWNDRASFARLQKLYIVADSKFRAGGGHNGTVAVRATILLAISYWRFFARRSLPPVS
jgi:hypothetical protein